MVMKKDRPSRHGPNEYKGLNPIKRLGHCECHRITAEQDIGWLESFLMKIIPHWDIVKEIKTECVVCKDGIPEDWTHCPFCLNGVRTETVAYLRRFYLFRSKWLGLNFGDVYLHHILRSDDDPDPHDHPWKFAGLVLAGGYTDEEWKWFPEVTYGTYDFVTDRYSSVTHPAFRFGPLPEEVLPFSVIIRSAEHIHRVILPEGKTAWTLIATGKYGRDWNFITKDGPVMWRKYLGIEPGVDIGE